MPYVTEVLSVGGDLYRDVTDAINPLNAAQKEFQFSLPPKRLSKVGFPFVRKFYQTTEIYKFLREHRNNARGHRPFLVAIINSELQSQLYRNLFGSHEAEEGLAVFTLHNHEKFVESR